MPRGVYDRAKSKPRPPVSADTRLKLSEANKGHSRTPLGEANHRWKGDEVGYNALHDWVSRHKERTGVCSHCRLQRPTHFANVSGDYLRDVDDYIELCVPCHKVFDV